ncbi:MAG: hypothetical protein QNK89_04395 [Lacinutrix sp.]|uniref:phage head spike fiber domain-containing protein n=1 Tax=Lacinutrix sp. TaxID=1937692 RepID=UPI0030955EEF
MKKPYFALIPSGYAPYRIFTFLPANSDNDLGFYRTTGSSRVAENGLIEPIFSGLTSLDWLNSSCPRLKSEETRTNLQIYSEDFTQNNWIKSNLSVTGNDTIDPKGVERADKIIPNTVNTFHHVQNIITGSGYGYSSTYSVFVKKAGYSQVELLLAYSASPFSTIAQVKFDLDTLETFGTTIGTAFEYQDYGNGWYRLQINAIVSLGATSAILRVAVFDQQSQTFLGNGVDGLYVWGAQFESLAAKASSYIPTLNFTASRQGDQISSTALLNNAAKGTIFLDLKAENVTNLSMIKLQGSSGYNRIVFQFSSSSQLSVQVGLAPAPPSFSYSYNHDQQRFRIAVAWERNGSLKIYINGVNVATTSAGTLNGISQFSFNAGYTTSNPFQGDVYEASVYNESLTDSELIELTTL